MLLQVISRGHVEWTRHWGTRRHSMDLEGRRAPWITRRQCVTDLEWPCHRDRNIAYCYLPRTSLVFPSLFVYVLIRQLFCCFITLSELFKTVVSDWRCTRNPFRKIHFIILFCCFAIPIHFRTISVWFNSFGTNHKNRFSKPDTTHLLTHVIMHN